MTKSKNQIKLKIQITKNLRIYDFGFHLSFELWIFDLLNFHLNSCFLK